jgi:hypothetical protein
MTLMIHVYMLQLIGMLERMCECCEKAVTVNQVFIPMGGQGYTIIDLK